MFFWFFRPKWKSRNAKRRMSALETMDLDENTILHMARSDVDLEIRKKAFHRISDISKFYSLWLGEGSEEGKDAILSILADHINASENPVAILEQNLMQENVRSFPLPNLLLLIKDQDAKKYVFSKITSNSSLISLIQLESEFRQQALERVTEVSVLEELIKMIRTTDKRSQRAIQERIDALKAEEKADKIKERLLIAYQALAEEEALPALNKLNDIEQEWRAYNLPEEHELRKKWKDHFLERFHLYNDKINQQRELIQKIAELVENGAEYSELSSSQQELESKKESLEQPYQRQAQALIDKIEKRKKTEKIEKKQQQSFRGVITQAQKVLAQPYRIEGSRLSEVIGRVKEAIHAGNKEPYETLLSQLSLRLNVQSNEGYSLADYQQKLETIEALIKSGDTNSAQEKAAEFESFLSESYRLPKKEYEQLNRAYRDIIQPLRDMQQWERWGSEQILGKLCEDAEALKNEDLSSDLVVVRLRQFRSDWREAAKSNRRCARALQERFNIACEEAFSRVREERKENANLRDVYIQEAHALLAQLDEMVGNLDWENTDWFAIQELRTTFLQKWNHYLAQTSMGEHLSYGAPLFLERDKRQLERKMRKSIAPLQKKIREFQKQDRERREALIASLKALKEQDDIQRAVQEAKAIRREFGAKIRLRYRDENRLWHEFRKHSSLVFEKQQALMSVNDQEREKNAEVRQQLLNDLHDVLTTLTYEKVNDVQELLHEIDEQWDEVGATPRALYKSLENQYAKLKQQVIEKKQDLIQEDKHNRFIHNQQVLAQLAQIETDLISGETVDPSVFETLEKPEHSLLRKRYDCLDKIIQDEDKDALNYLKEKARNADEEAYNLTILKEIITGQESPEADKERRLQLQIEHLPTFMMGNVTRDIHKQVAMLYNSWFENVVGVVDQSFVDRFFTHEDNFE